MESIITLSIIFIDSTIVVQHLHIVDIRMPLAFINFIALNHLYHQTKNKFFWNNWFLHLLIQIIILSISAIIFEINNPLINFVLVALSIRFIYNLKMLAVNNMHKIFLWCFILDILQSIIIVESKVYFTNNWFFWKFWITLICSFCIIVALVSKTNNNNLCIIVLSLIVLPIIMEVSNSSWIFFIFNDINWNTNISRSLCSEIRPDLVAWLKHSSGKQLLLKLCCIHHIHEAGASDTSNWCLYLTEHKKNKSDTVYYDQVSWEQFKKHVRIYSTTYLKFKDVGAHFRDFLQHGIGFPVNPRKEHVILAAAVMIYTFGIILDILVVPVIISLVMYRENRYQIAWLAVAYYRLLIAIIWRMYKKIESAILLSYIPRYGKWNIKSVQNYYRYIDEDIYFIKDILSQFLGNDIVKIVLSYTPDYIDILQQDKTDC